MRFCDTMPFWYLRSQTKTSRAAKAEIEDLLFFIIYNYLLDIDFEYKLLHRWI